MLRDLQGVGTDVASQRLVTAGASPRRRNSQPLLEIPVA
jgi:hypothetical protein